jgi:hypothetical protein
VRGRKQEKKGGRKRGIYEGRKGVRKEETRGEEGREERKE